jgi:FkbM family methyltransferase
MRRRRLRFYRTFIKRGDLVIDVGANIGERSELFLALGAKVVAVEPQKECAEHLRRRFGDQPGFVLFEGGCADRPGDAELFVGDADTLSSMSATWIDRMRGSGRFASHDWHETRVVPTTTLDSLIADHGVPAFVKIDVEGFEAQVLAGLSRPVRCLSVEWARESLSITAGCVKQLDALGMTRFNVSYGEATSWGLQNWVEANEVERILGSGTDPLAWGDVYARTTSDGA